MKLKGEIGDIGKYEDEFKNIESKVTILFKDRPKLMLGDCEVNQNERTDKKDGS